MKTLIQTGVDMGVISAMQDRTALATKVVDGKRLSRSERRDVIQVTRPDAAPVVFTKPDLQLLASLANAGCLWAPEDGLLRRIGAGEAHRRILSMPPEPLTVVHQNSVVRTGSSSISGGTYHRELRGLLGRVHESDSSGASVSVRRTSNVIGFSRSEIVPSGGRHAIDPEQILTSLWVEAMSAHDGLKDATYLDPRTATVTIETGYSRQVSESSSHYEDWCGYKMESSSFARSDEFAYLDPRED
jgi:hypothetical protein